MYHAIVRQKIRQSFDYLNGGDYESVVKLFAPTIHHTFAGDGAMGGERRGIDAAKKWYPRLFRLWPGLRFELRDVVIQGTPWNTQVVTRFKVQSTLPDGEPYQNEVIQFITLRWGRIFAMNMYEDTQKLAAALECKAAHGLAEAVAPPILN